VRFFSYEALAPAGERAVAAALYGSGVVPVVDLSGVDRILSLDCDFLGNEPVGEDSTAEFSATRNPDRAQGMSRLYSVEPSFTVTGGQADHRYRLPASQVLPVAALIAKELGAALGDASLASLADAVVSRLVPSVYNSAWIRECAADLAASKGKAVLVAGPRHSAEVHFLVAAANKALGAYGASIALVNHGLPAMETISALATAVEKAEVETLLVLNEGDLAFDAPSNLNFAAKLKGLKALVHVGPRYNETAKLATWHVPGAHYLESWGDHFSLSGVYSVQQPMINPLWGGFSVERFLLSLLQEDASGAALLAKVKAAYAAAGGKDWTVALRDGFAKEIKLPAGSLTGDPATQVAVLAKVALAGGVERSSGGGAAPRCRDRGPPARRHPWAAGRGGQRGGGPRRGRGPPGLDGPACHGGTGLSARAGGFARRSGRRPPHHVGLRARRHAGEDGRGALGCHRRPATRGVRRLRCRRSGGRPPGGDLPRDPTGPGHPLVGGAGRVEPGVYRLSECTGPR
jgi:hypothetical protein